jgi:ParB-like chromosome segregation protein Spo0J
LAARQLGIDEVPTMVARGWSDAKIRAYRLADNKLAELSSWDAELLGIEFLELRDLGAAMELTGFDAASIDDLMAKPDFEPTDINGQSRLDERAPITCPECGHQFVQ